MIGISTINCVNGGRGRTSGVVCSICIFLVLIVGYDILNYIPLPSLVGIMMIVVMRTFQWQSKPMLLSYIVGESNSKILEIFIRNSKEKIVFLDISTISRCIIFYLWKVLIWYINVTVPLSETFVEISDRISSKFVACQLKERS